MSLKDWKLILTSRKNNSWMNKKTKQIIHLNKTLFKDKRKQWYVNDDKGYINTIYFGNKLKALKFAKAYMRKH